MDDVFFISSKIIWMLISPANLMLIVLLLAWLLLIFNQRLKALLVLGLVSSCLIILSIFPVGSWMLLPLENRFDTNPDLPEQIDGIIVLGGSVIPGSSQEWGQLQTNSAHERLSQFIKLAGEYPEARLLFSGGNASLNRDQPTEADQVREYFIESGIAEDRLVLENKARNTAENVLLAKQWMTPEASQNWIVITTAYHMPRSVGLFCKHNWPVIPYPVDYQTEPSTLYQPRFNLLGHLNDLDTALHEWTGLLAYYLTGKISQILPDNCSSTSAGANSTD